MKHQVYSALLVRVSSQRRQCRLAATQHDARWYFTNADAMKRSDPYAQLGLQWGDGATLSEIKEAYKKKSLELHPDRNRDNPRAAAQKFQDLQKAYQTLINVHSNLNGISHEKDEEWRVSIWRNGDRIAINRTDVAGVAKKRPAPAAALPKLTGLLGHPDGRGVDSSGMGGRRPAEYLGEGDNNSSSSSSRPRISSSVGRGLSKWVEPKEFRPWNGGGNTAPIRASNFKNQTDSAPKSRRPYGILFY